MRRGPKALLCRAKDQMQQQDTVTISNCNEVGHLTVTHQAQCLHNESPSTQEMAHYETTKYSLDLSNTAVFRMCRKLTDQQTCAGSEKDLYLSVY
jgi:hypothetical protein